MPTKRAVVLASADGAMSRFQYHVDGAVLFSTVELPTLGAQSFASEAGATIQFDVEVSHGPTQNVEWFVERMPPGFDTPVMSTGRTADGYLVRIRGGADFAVSRDGSRIVAYQAGLPIDVIEQLLLDQLLPQVLHLRGEPTLHASCVSVGDVAVAFVGRSGDGKSTLASALVPPGKLLADDCLALRRAGSTMLALPSYGSVRLREDSAELTGRRVGLHPASSRTTWKLRLPLPQSASGLPLRRLFLLERAATPRIEAISAGEAFSQLLQHVHRLDPENEHALRREFETLADLTSLVRVCRLGYPRQYATLDEVTRSLGAELAKD